MNGNVQQALGLSIRPGSFGQDQIIRQVQFRPILYLVRRFYPDMFKIRRASRICTLNRLWARRQTSIWLTRPEKPPDHS